MNQISIFSGWSGETSLKIIISGDEKEESNYDAGKSQPVNKDGCIIMAEDTVKNKTIVALEEAARKLRNADISVNNEDVQNILHDVQDHMDQFKEEIGAKYHEVEAEYQKQVEPVENIICDHPIPAVLVAMGVGFLFGMLLSRSRD